MNFKPIFNLRIIDRKLKPYESEDVNGHSKSVRLVHNEEKSDMSLNGNDL